MRRTLGLLVFVFGCDPARSQGSAPPPDAPVLVRAVPDAAHDDDAGVMVPSPVDAGAPAMEPVVRGEWLRAFRERLDTASSLDEIDAFCKAAPPGVGFAIERGERDYTIRFDPPLRAALLVKVFAWSPAVAVSTDVHMSVWHIERRGARGRRPDLGANRQWDVFAALTAWPKGPKDPSARGPFFAHTLVDDDVVRSLSIGPRSR